MNNDRQPDVWAAGLRLLEKTQKHRVRNARHALRYRAEAQVADVPASVALTRHIAQVWRQEELVAISRRWSTDYGRGAHDYTDAGCRVLAEHAFTDIAFLLASVEVAA